MEYADIFSNQETPINGLYGLDNLGNTCYLNAIIQTLSNIPSFRKFLLDKEFEPFLINKIMDDNINDKINTILNTSIYQLFRLLQTIWNGSIDSESIRPSTIRTKLGKKNNLFRNSGQQDAQEAFIIIIELIHSEISQKINVNLNYDSCNILEKAALDFWINDYSPIYELFHGMYMNTRICSNCSTIHHSFEPNIFFAVDIPTHIPNDIEFNLLDIIDIKCKISNISISNETKIEMCKNIDIETIQKIQTKINLLASYNIEYNISECFDEIICDKTINDVICPSCDTKCDFISKTELAIAPKILCIHIKRFDNNMIKKNNLISFPLLLNINNLISNHVSEFKIKKYNGEYKLCSIINHSGNNLQNGHYFTYAFSSVNDKWYKFNDDNVSEINESNIVSSNAYLLFYERLD